MYALKPLLLCVSVVAAQLNYCTGDKSNVGHCTTLTFTDVTTTSPDPPTTAECNDTCRGVISDAGDWIVDFKGKPDGYRQNMLGYPCGFQMGRGPGEAKDYSFFMDNQDIIDILDEVNQRRYGPLHGGKVAAQGTVTCDGHTGTVSKAPIQIDCFPSKRLFENSSKWCFGKGLREIRITASAFTLIDYADIVLRPSVVH
ncbi:hypothetical protein EJ04DRAFT_482754 [Polyplosphaeria fusca]|uniref:Ecp2 effector protein-like domain-containing protein n=1 Tax=Polyplosphaeria fusca TaxID=682080 RepID=A0A9P4V7Z0_9PLEO|nr:hypothetical protein EJ04DRAFT_482754 [Polyplosphaeria fusca]